MRIKRSWLAPLACVAFAALAVTAVAHVSTQSGGGGHDTLSGHEHRDGLWGNSGCDDLLGRDGDDYLVGGPSGCDKARGMEGAPDAAIVWDDGVGNDEAYGGAGGPDQCYVGNQDWYDHSSCEVVFFP
jgi:hypothetical protein